MFFVTVAFLLIGSTAAQHEEYKIYQTWPSSDQQLKVLAELHANNKVDFWSPLRRDNGSAVVMVKPNAQKQFDEILQRYLIRHEVLINDLYKLMVEEEEKAIFEFKSTEISFTKYNRHHEINAYLDRLSKNYPDIASVETIGHSYEGRNLTVIKISKKSNIKKPSIFIDAGIHAREWISIAVALYAINQLVENPENADLLEKVDWHILPTLNPDGYEYSHGSVYQRFWRKTRSPGVSCYGTDANRNFDFHWAATGSSNDECAEIYHGKHAFSEFETVAVSDYVSKNRDTIKLYLTLHSFGQLILFPWGYTAELPEDSKELQELGEAVAKRIEEVDGTKYMVGSSTNVLYAAAGGSDDWVKGVAGVQLSYTIELPGGGTSGFNPPSTNILPVAKETWEGLKVYHDYISKKFN